MASSGPAASVDLVVALDYGQFYLFTAPTEDISLVVEAAIVADGVAQGDGTTVVLSPHQNNFAMPLRVELWSVPPPEDLDDWQQAIDVHLDVSSLGLFYESPTMTGTRLPVPPGSYRARISGRGFVAFGWPGTTEPDDQWRLQLWPDTGPAQPVWLKRFGARRSESLAEPSHQSALEAAREAAHRVNVDIARSLGARPLLPLDGIAVIRRWIAGDQMRVFRRVIDIAGRTSATPQPPVGSPPAPIVLRDNDPDRTAGRDFDGLPTGPCVAGASRSGGLTYQLQALFMTIEEPQQTRLSINWHRIQTAPDGHWVLQDVLVLGSTVHFTFAPETRFGEQGTSVQVEHSGLPRVWTADFCAIWECNLAKLD